jgi:signal transduction histidine kinase
MNSMRAKPTNGDPGPARDKLPVAQITVLRAVLPSVEVCGAGHIVRHASSGFCRLLGKSKADVVGKAFADLLPNNQECFKELDKIYRNESDGVDADQGSNSQYLFCILRANIARSVVSVETIIQVTHDSHFEDVTNINEALLISGLHQHELMKESEQLNVRLDGEITDRKLVEGALHEAKERLTQQAAVLESLVSERTEKLRETIGELEAFSYSIAHDMRSPLRTMSGFSQMLLQEYTGKLDAKGN